MGYQRRVHGERYQYHNKMASSSEPPPPYDASTRPNPASNINNLQVPNARNGIPPHDRRSVEDEFRDLPQGWTRQYDEQSHHQFFVDTRANPPRSIWHHPYDDEQYLSSLTPDERSRIQSLHRVPTPADIQAESSGDDEHGSSSHPPLPARDNSEKLSGAHKLGRKMKDKLTSSSHEEREAQRRKRAQEEQEAYQRHLHIRRQMSKAMETGEPQLLGKDRNGIPPHDRRSMEDEFRDLPQGWTRQYDEQSHHQFFVDTRANPPRSIWHHPYDDEQYLSSLTPDERSRIPSLHRVPTPADIQAESSGDDEHGSSSHPPLPARDNSEKLSGAHKLGRKMKDKLTSSSHEEREAQRRKRAQEEQEAYQRHLHIRRQMSKAMET